MKTLLPIAILFMATGLFSCKKENTLSSTSIQASAGSSSGRKEVGGSAGAEPTGTANAITSNFNGTPVSNGKKVWFNAHLKITNPSPGTPTIIYVNSGNVTFTDGGNDYTVTIPKSEVQYSSAITTASYNYDNTSDTWYIYVPANYIGNVFFAGAILNSTSLGGGINPVKYNTYFDSNKPGLAIDWQWSAAVYSAFSNNYNTLEVLPVDANGRHAGSPMHFQDKCVGGARGGGAADLTGSWSATGHVTTP
jgi:hypothetical protein